MAVLFFTGLESNSLVEWSSTAAASIATTTVRTGSFRLNLGTGGSARRVVTASAKLYVGWALLVPSTVTTGTINLLSLNGPTSTQHVIVTFQRATRTFSLVVGATTIGTYVASAMDVDSYNYLELSATVADVGGTAEFRLNGQTVITFTGDTRNTGADTTLAEVQWLHSGNSATSIDDMYVTDSGFLGDSRVEVLRPSGNGTSSGLTGSDGNSVDNYLQVDEVGAVVTADYNGHATVGNKDTYALSDLSTTSVVVGGVKVISHAAKSDAGAKQGRTLVRTGGTDFASSDHALTTTFVAYLTSWMLNPNTLAAWTAAEVNALEAGFEVRT